MNDVLAFVTLPSHQFCGIPVLPHWPEVPVCATLQRLTLHLLVASCIALLINNRAIADQKPTSPGIVSLPVEFEPNVGQSDDDALYIGRAGNLLIKLKRNLVEIDVNHARDSLTRVKLNFEGASNSIMPDASGPTSGESNYLTGNEPSEWRTHVPDFKNVVYHQLYPAIDVRFYGNEQYIEHDFVIAPGGDPRDILVHVSDLGGRLSLTDSGDLNIAGAQAVVFRKPVVYQLGPDGKHAIEGKFVLRGKDTFGFDIGEYDVSRGSCN
jgi:hypothetical protein